MNTFTNVIIHEIYVNVTVNKIFVKLNRVIMLNNFTAVRHLSDDPVKYVYGSKMRDDFTHVDYRTYDVRSRNSKSQPFHSPPREFTATAHVAVGHGLMF